MAKKTFCDRCEQEIQNPCEMSTGSPGNKITFDLCVGCVELLEGWLNEPQKSSRTRA